MRLITVPEWSAVLRSGKYTQGMHLLRRATGEACCLGVLMEESEVPSEVGDGVLEGEMVGCYHYGNGGWYRLPDHAIMAQYGLTPEGSPIFARFHGSLSFMNDGLVSFEKIADKIDEWFEKGYIHNPPESDE